MKYKTRRKYYIQYFHLNSITDRVNNVEPSMWTSIQQHSTFFLDVLLYHQPTCKNEYIHLYSYHNTNTKRRLIDFHLQALHICISKYLNDEFNCIYPRPFIQFAKVKALTIHNRSKPQTNINITSNKLNLLHAHITLSNNSSTNIKRNNLNKLGIKTVTSSSKIIHDLLHDFTSSTWHHFWHRCLLYCVQRL